VHNIVRLEQSSGSTWLKTAGLILSPMVIKNTEPPCKNCSASLRSAPCLPGRSVLLTHQTVRPWFSLAKIAGSGIFVQTPRFESRCRDVRSF